MGFPYSVGKSILSTQLQNTYIGLLSEVPAENTSSSVYSELPTTSLVGGSQVPNGYCRKSIGTLHQDDGQIANSDIVFICEITQDIGYAKAFALFTTPTAGSGEMKYFGKIPSEGDVGVLISKGCVPLIRAKELIIGLDRTELKTYKTN